MLPWFWSMEGKDDSKCRPHRTLGSMQDSLTECTGSEGADQSERRKERQLPKDTMQQAEP